MPKARTKISDKNQSILQGERNSKSTFAHENKCEKTMNIKPRNECYQISFTQVKIRS